MNLPELIEAEVKPFISDFEPTPKEKLIERIKEYSWHKANVKTVLNFIFSIPCTLFYKSEDGNIFYT